MLRFSRLQLVFAVLFNEATDVSLIFYSRSPLETYMLSLSTPTTSAITRTRSHSGLRFAHLEFGCIHLKSIVVSQKHNVKQQRHIPVHVVERGSHDLPESATSLVSIIVLHAFVIIPRQVMISAAYLVPVRCSRSIIVLKRLSK